MAERTGTGSIDPFAGLNEAQRAVVQHRDGPLRIVAGAGAGKTHTLTRSVIALVQSGAAAPEEILALTFTRKAAEELRDRMSLAVRSLDPNARDVDVDTYNAFGGRIVRQHGYRIGLPPDPVILTESDAWILLWRVLDRVTFTSMDWAYPKGVGGVQSPIRRIITMGNRLRDELRDLDDLTTTAAEVGASEDPDLDDIIRALRVYEDRKRELGAIDYGDQIVLACQLLEDDDVRDYYGKTYKYLLVDEFQDTNFAQRVMVRGLGSAVDGNVRVVGDPNQAIYAFRGAAPDNLERFVSEDFPDALTIELNLNYRSTIQILDVANTLWKADPGPFRGNLDSGDQKWGPKVVLAGCQALHDEAAFIAEQINEHHRAGVSYANMAVLVRKNAPKRALFRTLSELGIPIELLGGSSLYERPEIQLLISALRVIAGEQDDPALAHVLSSDRWGLDETSLFTIAKLRNRGESLINACRRIVVNPQTDTARMLAECMDTLGKLAERAFVATLPQVIDQTAQDLLGALDPVPAANVARFKAVVAEFASGQIDHPSLKELIVYIDLLLSSNPEEDAVTSISLGTDETVKMMTVHSAKGLEWPIVFVATANKNDQATKVSADALMPELVRPAANRPVRADFPSGAVGRSAFREAIGEWEKQQAEEEARRILYVALTRAQEQLYITWSARSPGRTTESSLAPMALELVDLCECVEPTPIPPPDPDKTMPAFARRTLPFLTDHLDDVTADSASWTLPGALLADDWASIGGRIESIPFAIESFLERKAQVKLDLDLINLVRQRRDEARKELLATSSDVVTYSKIETFRTCPHRFYLRHRVGLPGIPDRAAATYGTDVHEFLRREAESRKSGELHRFEGSNRPVQPVTSGMGTQDPEASHDPVETYLASSDATAEPLLIEAEFAFALGDVQVSGVIDRAHRLPDGTVEVVDYKTDRRLRTSEQVRDGLQLQLYLIAMRRAFPDIKPTPNQGVMFFLRFNKRVEITVTTDQLADAERQIVDFAERMKSVTAEEHRASPESCRFCEYRLSCRFSQAT